MVRAPGGAVAKTRVRSHGASDASSVSVLKEANSLVQGARLSLGNCFSVTSLSAGGIGRILGHTS